MNQRLSLPVRTDPAQSVKVADLRAALTAAVEGEVRFDRLSRALYATDASVYQIVPLGVVLPRSEEDVRAALRICRRFGVPVTARGGGTSQAGQAIGPGIILDCSKYLHRVLEINPQERWARVQPGCVLEELNAQVRPWGLHFPVDISTADRATLGGMIANNSSGTRSVCYGKTIDHVLELKAVLADDTPVHCRPLTAAEWTAHCQQADREGQLYRLLTRLGQEHAAEIARRYPRLLRRVGGYNLDYFTPDKLSQGGNLAHLLVGSEGTLAVILEARVALTPLPAAQGLLVIEFADLLEALAATPAILEHNPSAVEVIDRYILEATRNNAEARPLRRFLQSEPAAILLVELSGKESAEVRCRLERLQASLQRQGWGSHFYATCEPADQARIWKLRRLALGLSMAEKGDAKAISFVEDTAVAPAQLRDYIADFLKLLAAQGTTAGIYAHASVGCLHVRPVINLKTEEGVRRFETLAQAVADLVLRYGGALSGEHGDGLVRSPFQEKMFGPVLYSAFREIKNIFDPERLLNPGKIVDAPPLTQHLRYGPAYVTPEVPTIFDFQAEGGMVRAAELCVGVGECRRLRGGAMCPSYQATREEQHSTRGRANLLRLALTGQLGLRGLADPAVHQVLDLCLECKACKRECPTNVDLARLKAEALHHYYRVHGVPLRQRLFAHVADWTRWGGRLANRWLRSRLGRWLGEVFLRIDRRRLAPALAAQPFFHGAWYEQLPAIADGPPLLLFPDTFTVWYEPENAWAALTLLACVGYAVRPGLPAYLRRLPPASKDIWPRELVCCGRPFISNGLLEAAVQRARQNVRQLYPWAAAGGRITACEPSCLLTLQDDYPALLRGPERRQAEIVAAACLTLAEALEQRLTASPERLPLRPRSATLLVQPHCHERALVGSTPLMHLLQRIPGAKVIDVEAGCCGQAGSFGYEKEHYELSRQVGELRLFPAVRQMPAAILVASGFSCRQQIAHFTGRPAWHPAPLLAALLDRNVSRLVPLPPGPSPDA
jgi:FAD/FMN-containing dehydrogenase/Fe-S oxidoreductase